MKMNRSTAVATAAVAALAATGITYVASFSGRTRSAPAVHKAAVPAQVPFNGGNAKGRESRGQESWGDKGWGHEDWGYEDWDDEDWGDEGEEFSGEGLIRINERSYSSFPGDCVTVVSGLGARSLNIRNDSRRTVEVFRGVVCDNGAPIATVGPHSSSDGVTPPPMDGISVQDGVVGSFRVVGRHGERARRPW
jgi:hypothetical protein